MGAVKFYRLECIKQEDWNGKDDIYITINGKRVYSTRIGEDGTRTIDKTYRFEGDVAEVRMYESDDADADDLLGEQVPLLGYNELKFREDGAHYVLSCELS
ncbi:hypothetical protein [Streptomyces sp. NPDC020742]|uniref:hypothetical protein n=1 Tax=Streptomyces sp. NPDC020742 TaxID=3154897 RepID=UPI0033DAD514